ncbi:MAG: histidine kinase [Clostridia bacterium]|nr:histidine kinase [Clostridia bacterium]
MKENRRFRKLFLKNIILIAVMLLIFSLVAITFFAVFRGIVKKEKIEILETEETLKIGVVTENVLYHIASSAMYFSARNFFVDVTNPQKDYLQTYSIKNEMQTVCSTFGAIESIGIKNIAADYLIHTERYSKNEFEKGKEYGNFGGVMLYENLNKEGPALFMVVDDVESETYLNEVYIGINTEYLAENILLNNSEKRTEYIIDSEGNIIISEKLAHINKKIEEIYNYKPRLDTKKSIIESINGSKKIITSSRIENLDFYVITFADASIYDNLDSANTLMTTLMMCGFIIAGCIISYFIFKITYKPIEEILSTTGDMAIMDPKSLDEVQYINQKIRKLTVSNNELSNMVDEKVEELTIQHIAALQSQICPHFVYNTLEAINWIAYETLNVRKNRISNAINNLSVLYKSAMNINEIFRSIEDECMFTETYLEILDIRKPDTFKVEWQVDESVKKYNILKLSIQPFIENIANHALGKGRKKVNIRIMIQDLGENIRVTVQDDGVGISPERLSEIRNAITDFDSGEHHLGLRNTNERLQLLYGEEYGIVITSSEGNGTVISFLYPKSFQN